MTELVFKANKPDKTESVTVQDPMPTYLTHSIGVALSSNEMAVYLSKGTPLPARHRETHHTTIAFKKGESGTILRIPVVEGENYKRADRNTLIGTLEVKAKNIKLDLPIGSEFEITIEIDESRLVKTEAYIPILDELYDEPMKLGKIAPKSHKQLLADFKQEKDRLQKVQEKAKATRIAKAEELLEKIRLEQMVEDTESLLEAARNDTLSADKFQRSLLELRNAIDDVDNELMPTLVAEAEEELELTHKVINRYGTADDRSRFQSLEDETRRAIAAQDSDLLHRKIDELDVLSRPILIEQPVLWVQALNDLLKIKSHMRDQLLVERLIARGHLAVDGNDVAELRAVTRQLVSLLPQDEPPLYVDYILPLIKETL